MERNEILNKVLEILDAYNTGKLGDTTMPEDTHPNFLSQEEKLIYYTLPMALNYQRNSYKLWEAAKLTWEDTTTNSIFNLEQVSIQTRNDLQVKLAKYKLGLQPNKHTDTWHRISQVLYNEWGSIENLLKESESDYLNLRELVQFKHKKQFPYLSGPKIFNYWSYIIQEYCDTPLLNREYIEIAPDTHVIQASIKLGILDKYKTEKLSREKISKIWREILNGTEISPIDVHSPLWFWSRGGFKINK